MMPVVDETSAALRVAIVGGGITGLAAAYYLERQAAERDLPLRCVLLEAEDRLGGKVQTERIGGFVLEQGPDSFLARKAQAQQLCVAVGLGDQVVQSNPDARGTGVLHRGRLEDLPDSMVLVAPTRLGAFLTTRLLSPLGKARAACDLVLPARAGEEDESLAAFVSRRFGREVAERLAVPLLASVYGGGSGDLSLLASFPDLRRLEQTHRSVLVGLRTLDRQRGPTPAGSPFVTLRDGLHALVDRLSASLRSTEVRRHADVRRLALAPGQGDRPVYYLELASGQTIDVDAVILATPATAASRILERLAPRAAENLARISYVPALVVTIAFARTSIAQPLRGSGFLVPAAERLRLIACTYVSRKWPHAGEPDAVLLRCYLGGPDLTDLLTREDQDLVALVRDELTGILGIGAAPRLARVYRWPHGIPRYAVGHLERVQQAEKALESLPGVVLAGAAYHGIGVPDCIRQGEDAARAVLTRIWQPVPAT